MQIDLSELFTCDGKSKDYQLPFTKDVFYCQAGNYPIIRKSPVDLSITHEANRKMLLKGSVNVTLQIPCDRCLESVEYPIRINFDKKMDLNATDQDRLEELDEQPFINGFNLDIDELVCGELIVNMPMKVLCNENCKGICKRCGANLNHETCHCDVTELDPRMSVIRDIFNNFKEV
ncbi:MAG: YceD family protein [Lachnospiraceae bacterium]